MIEKFIFIPTELFFVSTDIVDYSFVDSLFTQPVSFGEDYGETYNIVQHLKMVSSHFHGFEIFLIKEYSPSYCFCVRTNLMTY